MSQSDARLLQFARAGHERAFEALVRRYRRPLLGYCRRLLLSEERAEDALQQALLQAWLALRDGAEVNEFRPWLFRVVHNAALNALRVSGYDYCKLSESLSGADAPQADLDRRIAVREALAGLAALPEMQREALLRTAVEGRSHQQVARDLGLSENALRGLVYRARTTLRAAVGALTPPPLLSWALGSGVRGTPVVERLAELGAGGGATGVAALLMKGGAAAVTAGVLAGGIAAVHPHGKVARAHAKPHTARLTRMSDSAVATAVTQEPVTHWTAAAHIQRARGDSHRHPEAKRKLTRSTHPTSHPVTTLPAAGPVLRSAAAGPSIRGERHHHGEDGGVSHGEARNWDPNRSTANQGGGGHDRTGGQARQGSDGAGDGSRQHEGQHEGTSGSGSSSPDSSGDSPSGGGGSSSQGDGAGRSSGDGFSGGGQQEPSATSGEPAESRDRRGSPDTTPPTSPPSGSLEPEPSPPAPGSNSKED